MQIHATYNLGTYHLKIIIEVASNPDKIGCVILPYIRSTCASVDPQTVLTPWTHHSRASCP